ncbi:MAG TPA: FKBP-type peptidyl-prolyl cis-trans isomerase [Kofleriaceae bacterium]|nr:FKBP-type peptidyl-prolyl cis-trans isomerase [Kofleriaceae bacterium]
MARARTGQVTPPFDLKTPPADATKTASGLVYKKIVANEAGAKPHRNDTVLINYTGWHQSTGDTFFTNRASHQPLPLNLTKAAPGFVEAMQLLHKGEKAMLWMPPAIGYETPPAQGAPETLVYEVEIVDLTLAPAIPDNVAKPPDNAEKLPSGTQLVVLRPGTGKDKARQFDNVTFDYTAWDGEGRMVHTTEMRKGTITSQPYKQPIGMVEMLTAMTAGERARFWIDSERVKTEGKLPPGMPQGQLCYEVEIQQIVKAEHEPPPTPPDVAKPPPGVSKTANGVLYRVLKPGSAKNARHPTENDTVKVQYTGWTTDGRMFDSSVLRGELATFNLHGVIPGWTEGIPEMGIGDRVRFWIPQELAYKGQPGKPAGMLVFDVELFEIVAPTSH